MGGSVPMGGVDEAVVGAIRPFSNFSHTPQMCDRMTDGIMIA